MTFFLSYAPYAPPLALVSLLALSGCASKETYAVEAKTPMADGYAAGYPAPAPPREQPRIVALESTNSASRPERTVGIDSAGGGGDKDAKKAEPPPAPAPAPAPAPPPAAPQQPAGSQPQQQPTNATAKNDANGTREVAQNRDLVIYTARFTMAVYQVDQGIQAVEKIARDNGGYLGQKKDREITVRIPRGRFEPTLGAIDKIGDVLHRDINAHDVTDEHVDLEIRIKNARAMQKRLSDLLTKASVKDALEIEKELHRVTEELERLEGRFKVLRDQIAFSTITVSFEARGSTIQATRARLPFPWLGGMNLPSLLSLSENK